MLGWGSDQNESRPLYTKFFTVCFVWIVSQILLSPVIRNSEGNFCPILHRQVSLFFSVKLSAFVLLVSSHFCCFFFVCLLINSAIHRSFRFTAKLGRKISHVPMPSTSRVLETKPKLATTLTGVGVHLLLFIYLTLITINWPTLTYNHPKSIAYIITHSCYCTFYGFGQIDNFICPPL